MKANLKFAVVLTVVFFSVGVQQVLAQFNVKHERKSFVERGKAVEFVFELAIVDPVSVADAYLMYRTDADQNEIRNPVLFTTEGVGKVRIDLSDIAGSEFSYYFVAELNDGSTVTFPDNNPKANPIIAALVEPSDESKAKENRSGEFEGVEFTILSPEPNKRVYKHDLVVAIALFYEEGAAELTDFKLEVNGTNVTKEADITPYFISWVPTIVEEGDYNVVLTMGGTTLVDYSFTSSATPPMQSAAFETTGKKSLNVMGNGELSARNQIIGGNQNDAYRGNFNVSASYGNVRFAANGLGTSQEDPRLQPQNRLGAEVSLGKWFDLQAGHIYPVMNPLVLNGRRVYGVNAGLHLFNRNLNFQATVGELARSIPSLYNQVEYSPTYNILASGDTLRDANTGEIVENPRYLLTYQNNGAGTFTRQIMAGRLSFGNGKYFSLGFNAIKVEDQIESIVTVRNMDDLPEELLPSDPNQLSQLHADSTLLQIQAAAPRPVGNFVFATDLAINADKGRIRLKAEGAANLLNDDIQPGVLNRQRADDLGFDLDDELLDIFDRLAIILVVNENMRNLPIRFEENEDGTSTVTPFVPMGIFGGQGNLSLNYLRNNINVRYQWLGPDFQPLSNNAIRRDIAGFSVRDRISLFKNRLYFNLGYEDMTDNVLGFASQTTNTLTYNGGLSIYPISMKLPRVTVSYRLQTRNNGIIQENPFLINVGGADLRNRAIRNVRATSADTTLLSNPRDISTNQYNVAVSQQIQIFGMIQDFTFNYTNIDTRDAQFAFGDYLSDIFSIGFSNRFTTIPLTLTGSYNLNQTNGLSGLSDIRISGFTAGAEFYMFDEKLMITGNLAVANNKNKTFNLVINNNETDDFVLDDYYESGTDFNQIESTSYIISGRAMYRFSSKHAIAASINLTNVQNRFDNTPIPNDRILQARYILSF